MKDGNISDTRDYFSNAPEFISLDNRQRRVLNPVTHEQMTKKHRAMFSDGFVKGKSVLDLGSCLGATGHWVLSAGAKSYTGVETQEVYTTESKKLLDKYHPGKANVIKQDLEEFLDTNNEKYDIVVMLGVIYVFVDYFSILKKISKITNEYVIIESMYDDLTKMGNNDFCGVVFISNQGINLGSEDGSLVGRGVGISPLGLDFIMKELDFIPERRIKPEKINESRDVYNMELPTTRSARFIVSYKKSVDTLKKSLSDQLNNFKGDGKVEKWY